VQIIFQITKRKFRKPMLPACRRVGLRALWQAGIQLSYRCKLNISNNETQILKIYAPG
jgi:hypothetical protein